MAITSNELLGARTFKKLMADVSSIGNCGICGKQITDTHPDDVRVVSGKSVHDDCYFMVIGKEVEQHPIGHPQMHL